MTNQAVSWLTNHEIEAVIERFADRSTREAFLGIFPLDTLPPRVEQRPAFLIVNTQTADLPGRHWLCLLLMDNEYGEVFNSVGVPPPPAIARWMSEMVDVWTYNDKTYQLPGTATCGAFCVYVILHRLQYPSLSRTLRTFTTSLSVNDCLITHYYRIIKQAM